MENKEMKFMKSLFFITPISILSVIGIHNFVCYKIVKESFDNFPVSENIKNLYLFNSSKDYAEAIKESYEKGNILEKSLWLGNYIAANNHLKSY